MQDETKQPLEVMAKRTAKKKCFMNEYKIMIVDDEPDILSLLEKAFNI
ncbi:MAG: hypothetical protein HFJ04_14215 [Lachnospiraceae bacterium]|nr:hypothetical protein [Lachnospiraceae bacterium]